MELQRHLFDIVKAQIGKLNVAVQVSEILNISEDAAYRRIRGEKELSFTELEKICLHFNIPLDKLINTPARYRILPYHFYNQNYFDMEDMDLRMSGDYVTAIKAATKDKYSEYGFATNTMTLHTRTLYPPLFKFFILKWMYQYKGPNEVTPYSKIHLPAELIKHHQQYSQYVRDIKYTYIIYQESLMQSIVQDVSYFRDIKLLNNDEVALIKENLLLALARIETLAKNGVFDTGNKIDLYISGLFLDTSYSYLCSDNITISMMDAFTVGAASSVDRNNVEMMKNWVNSLKRNSTILTGSEKNRISFIELQRAFINRL